MGRGVSLAVADGAHVAKNALPVVDATQATAGELPAYALGRLQTKVRQTLGRPAGDKEPDRSFVWGLRWWLGLAAATAVVALVVLPGLRTPSGPVIQAAIKIVCDRAAGEVRVLGRWEGKPVEKTFLIEQDLAATLKLVRKFIQEQTKR